MNLHVSAERTVVVAAIEGRFDAHEVASFTTRVTEGVDVDAPHAVIDLSEVEFMDAGAIAALVRLLQRAMGFGGSVVLVGASPAAQIILQLTRLDQVFAHATSVDEALRGLVSHEWVDA